MKKPRAIIVHRWEKSPKGDWYPWLAKELRRVGWKVEVPLMPNPDTPSIDPWVRKLAKTVGHLDENTFFVGHSIGCQTILRYLERKNTRIGGTVFVTPWFTLKKMDKESEEVARPWVKTPIALHKARKLIPRSLAIFAADDPYVPLEPNVRKFKEVGSTVLVFKKGAHFTKEDGFKEIPLALGWLLAAASFANPR